MSRRCRLRGVEAVVATAAVALGLACAPAPGASAGPIAPCAPGGSDHCGFNRPEDLVPVDAAGRWLLVSQESPDRPLVFLDTRSGARVDAWPSPADARAAAPPATGRPASVAACPGPPGPIEAGGNDVRRLRAGHRAAVLNRAGSGRIELFEVVLSRVPRLRWIDCVPAPPGAALNDVALAPDGGLYASQMFERPRDQAAATALRARFLAAAPTGRALRWRAATGWVAVPGTEVSFANGIAVSADGRWLALAGTFDQAVLLVPRAGGTVRRVPLGLQPDNLTRRGAAGFVVAGHTGVPVTGVDPCRDPGSVPCGFPFAISRIDAPAASASRLRDDDGRSTPGASVAVELRGLLYVGSAFGDRVAVLELEEAEHGRR